MKKLTFVYILIFITFLQAASAQNERPKLIVGIVVDQMRYDYITRYYDKFGEGGFKRLLKKGFNCKNTHYNYVPTETAPGHASVYTGTTPAYHGIVANDWFEDKKKRYCVGDSTVKTVGSETSNGEMSPRNMIATTFGDQLRIASNQKSKVFGVSLKDRGAILPAGHAANAAFWYDKLSGKFITSTYYMNQLPTWVQQFNEAKPADKYLEETWETMLPLAKYTESAPDDNTYERLLPGKERPTFPYNLKKICEAMKKTQFKMSPYDLLTITPYGNTLVKEMAIRTLTNEKLGKGEATDILAISFSSTDIIGHYFGPQSVEVEDCYLRLDKDLEELLEYFDKEVGEENYLLFLTADHAGANVPRHAQDMKIPAGYFPIKDALEKLSSTLNKQFGDGKWIDFGESSGIYLNKALIAEKELSLEDFQETCIDFFRKTTGVYEAYSTEDFGDVYNDSGMLSFIQRGYYHLRSPDVYVVLKSGWLDESWQRGGTSHGTLYNYDTHVPLLWYGWKVPQGKNTVRRVYITDIAPSVCMFLNLQMPSLAFGEPVIELWQE